MHAEFWPDEKINLMRPMMVSHLRL